MSFSFQVVISGLNYFLVKTSHWNGVVTAFITMSDIKDEIDWEWPGNQVTEAQTNYFWQGMIGEFTYLLLVYHSNSLSSATPTNGDTAKDLSDTSSDYHEYTVSSSVQRHVFPLS